MCIIITIITHLQWVSVSHSHVAASNDKTGWKEWQISKWVIIITIKFFWAISLALSLPFSLSLSLIKFEMSPPLHLICFILAFLSFLRWSLCIILFLLHGSGERKSESRVIRQNWGLEEQSWSESWHVANCIEWRERETMGMAGKISLWRQRCVQAVKNVRFGNDVIQG